MVSKIKCSLETMPEMFFLLESKYTPPKPWSSSPLMIRTVEIPRSSFHRLDCVYNFEQTMPQSEWEIERVCFSLIILNS